MAKFDTYQEVTDKILKTIEDGTPAWRKPWSGGTCSTFPTRENGEYYQGINVLMLWLAADTHKFNSPYWMTFKQVRNHDAAVRKGEKATRVIYYGTLEPEEGGDKIPYIKTYAAFNASQIDGLPEKFNPAELVDYGTTLTPEIMNQFDAFPIQIKQSEEYKASYHPVSDFVEMPPAQNFVYEKAYYATLAHELIHATAHNSRLDRASDKVKYSFEELIAEIGACMVCARLGIEPDFEQSAAYVEHWHKILDEDKKAIFKAASKAQAACNYVLDHILSEPVKECA